MVQELPKNQLNPTAKPVNRFLSYRSEQPAAPPKLVEMPTPKGVNIVQRSNEMSVQGYNSFKQLSDALKQTSQAVSQLGPVVKSIEEQKGRNDVIKSLALANRQAINSAENYAATNKQVSREDAIAGMMMDEVNPWRQKAREDQLSKLAAGEAGIYMDRVYNKYAAEIVSLDPLNPRLDQIKAEAVTKLAQDWGVDETSASFIDYTIPSINKAWQSFNSKHLKVYTKFQKQLQKTLTKAQLYQALTNWKKEELTENDLVASLGTILNDQVKKLGLPLEPTEFKKEVLLELRAQLEVEAADPNNKHAQKAESYLGMLESVPVHMVTDDKGNVTKITTAGEMFGADFLFESNKISKTVFEIKKRDETKAENNFVLKWAEEIVSLEKGSTEYQEKVNELFNDDSLPYHKKIILFNDIDKIDTARAEAQFSFSKVAVEEIFARNQSVYGEFFDEVAVRKELTKSLSNIPSELASYKAQKWKEFATLARQKRTEAGGAYESSLINNKVKEAAVIQIENFYPELKNKYLRGEVEGLSIENYLGKLKLYQADSGRTYKNELIKNIYSNIGKAMQEKGELTLPEQNEIIDNTINEFNKDAKRLEAIFTPPDVKKVEKKVEKKEQAPKAYSWGTIKTLSKERVKANDYKKYPLINKKSTQDILKYVMEENRMPAAMIDAANKYNISPYQLLIDTLEHYKDEEFYPSEETRNYLSQKGEKLLGLKNAVKGFSPGSGQLSDATNYIAYALSGTVPKRFIYRG